MSKLSLWKVVILMCVFCAAGVIGISAQSFTSLVSFDQTNGAHPYYGSLVQGIDGNLYGTTFAVPASTYGTVFRITPGGALTTLHSFDSTDGANPSGGLVQAPDGSFYGTTYAGGIFGSSGTVFKISPGGTLTPLHSFDASDGLYPYAGLVQAPSGSFYGTTAYGGVNGYGTVSKIAPGGTLTTLYSFCVQTNCTDGAGPYAGLVQGTNGNLYGTTYNGGAGASNCAFSGCGTVFRVSPGGTLTKLHSFHFSDGAFPYAGLVQARDGNFYGTTAGGGGAASACNFYGCGTVFKITPGGTMTTLYHSCAQTNCTDGAFPYAGLVQGTDENFYGTTAGGGEYGDGTVFRITPAGALAVLHSFNGTDGSSPYGGLVQATNGTFYGTTYAGGANGYGTIFSLAVGLGLFVKTLPTTGKVGATVIILGNNLTGATGVTFNGTPAATFKVVSSTEIKTSVPSGATTGFVKVTTPRGTLTSNLDFRVLP